MENNQVVRIKKGNIRGVLNLPPSKSLSHRYIIGAALGCGTSIIRNIADSEDITSTISLMEILGAKFKVINSYGNIKDYSVVGNNGSISYDDLEEFFCNESGSTIRFLIPLLLLNSRDTRAKVTGAGKLVSRPQSTYYKLFAEKGIKYETKDGELPLILEGKLSGGEFFVDGNVSSQFITGLLFTLPLLKEDSVLHITTELESKPYVDLTLDTLQDFGIEVENNQYKSFVIKGNQVFKPLEKRIEGDLSQLAFFAVLGVIGSGEITVLDCQKDSKQGDKVIIDIIKEMGGNVKEIDNGYIFSKSNLQGITIDVKDCPDTVPALGLLGSMARGTTKIINGERLRIKESDRLEATKDYINALGGKIKVIGDTLEITGVDSLKGGSLSSFNDHRIAMSATVARVVSTADIYLEGYLAVHKSFTNFYQVMESIGGEYIYE